MADYNYNNGYSSQPTGFPGSSQPFYQPNLEPGFAPAGFAPPPSASGSTRGYNNDLPPAQASYASYGSSPQVTGYEASYASYDSAGPAPAVGFGSDPRASYTGAGGGGTRGVEASYQQPLNDYYGNAPPPPPPQDLYGATYQPQQQSSYPSSSPFPPNDSSNNNFNAYPPADYQGGVGLDPAMAGQPGERGIMGAMAGGAAGAYVGHKNNHGFLGFVGGAIMGHLAEDALKAQKRKNKPWKYGPDGKKLKKKKQLGGSRAIGDDDDSDDSDSD